MQNSESLSHQVLYIKCHGEALDLFLKVLFTLWYSEKLLRVTFQRPVTACIASSTAMHSLLRRTQSLDVEGRMGPSSPSPPHAVKQDVFTGPLATSYQRTGVFSSDPRLEAKL